jgi:hypothetical protein
VLLGFIEYDASDDQALLIRESFGRAAHVQIGGTLVAQKVI